MPLGPRNSTMRTMAFMWCMFFLCATMARFVRRTGKTLRGTTRVMTIATRSTRSVLECVLYSDFKGFFSPVAQGFFFPVGQGFFSYVLLLCVLQRVFLSRRSRVAYHASSGRYLRDSRSAARRHADCAPMLRCRAVPFARRRRRRVSNNCSCVAAAAFGQVYLLKGSKRRLYETRSQRHTDVRKEKPRGGKKIFCSSLVKRTAPKPLLCPPIRPPPGHASASGAPPRSASLPKRLTLAQTCLQVARLRVHWRAQWRRGDRKSVV